MELMYDEYGAGDPNRLHSHLFARGMEAAGLRAEYGAYVDEAPAEILEQNNAMTLFGLHRRWRGAALGHLAAFEATSSLPSRRMAQGLERLGFAPELVEYYTEHVEADAVHEQLAVRTICGSLVEAEPTLADDVFFGAFTCLDLEDRVATLAARRSGGPPRERRPDLRAPRRGHLPGRADAAAGRPRRRGRRRGGAPDHPSGQRRLPLRQVRDQSLVRRHAQGAAGAATSLTVGRTGPGPRGRRS